MKILPEMIGAEKSLNLFVITLAGNEKDHTVDYRVLDNPVFICGAGKGVLFFRAESERRTFSDVRAENLSGCQRLYVVCHS